MNAATSALLDRVRAYALPKPIEARGTWLKQVGEMRLKPEGAWSAFTAAQRCNADPPGFRWKARIHLAPMFTASVTDAYEAHRGFLRVTWFGLPLTRASGPETSTGELMRFLAELPWCPVAYQHPALTWNARGDRTLRVELRDGDTHATVSMDVDQEGAITACRGRRPRMVSGKRFALGDWSAEFGDYRQFGDLRMPESGSVSWDLPDGRFTYWRGEIVDAGLITA
jgi:hypothetical protein